MLLSRGEKAFQRIEALHIQTRPQIDGDFTFLHSIQNILVVFSFNSSSSDFLGPVRLISEVHAETLYAEDDDD